MTIRVAALAVLLLAPTAGVAQTARRVAEGVFVLPTGRDGATAGWVDLGPDVLAIATGAADPAVARIRRASGKPIRAVFAPNGTGAGGTGAVELVPSGRAAAAGLGFSGTMTLGARRMEVKELERAVSAGNGVVWVPDARVLFAGHLVGEGALVDSTRTEAWLRLIHRLQLLDPVVVVPGRGAPGGPELLERTRAALAATRTAVAAAVARRAPAEEITRSGPHPDLARHVFREMVGLIPPPLIDELELRPGPSPTARTAGWTRPTVVVIQDMWPEKTGRMAELAYVAPGVEVRVVRTAAEAAARVADADGLLGGFSAEAFRRANRLRWVQSASAGVEGPLAVPGFAASPIVLTNAQKVYAPPLGEHTFGLLLGLTRRLQVAVPLMKTGSWTDSLFRGSEMPELRGKTLLVAGLGGIGTEVATIGRAMGMRVIATRNNKTPPTDLVEYVGGASELARLATEADVVVNALPLTPATANVFDEALFRGMKPTAYFINIGRGGTVDTEALTRALEEGRLAGAGLDVTRPEPLPAGHRLWSLPNVIITPHVGSTSDWERERTWILFRENLRRFVAGEPLLSVVDKKAAY